MSMVSPARDYVSFAGHRIARVSAALTVVVFTVVASVGYAQQESQTDSVADAARQQKQSKSEQRTSAKKKVYNNADVVPADAAAEKSAPANPPTALPQGESAAVHPLSVNAGQAAAVKNTQAQDSEIPRSSILDRSKPASPESIVVPAGTKITVGVFEENPPRNLPLRVHSAKVVNIVQVGSTVVIPALSKVTIQESVGVMELADVTINGVRYDLQTDRVALLEGSMSEATFTLTKDFTIKR
jgi:hypothetical protein